MVGAGRLWGGGYWLGSGGVGGIMRSALPTFPPIFSHNRIFPSFRIFRSFPQFFPFSADRIILPPPAKTPPTAPPSHPLRAPPLPQPPTPSNPPPPSTHARGPEFAQSVDSAYTPVVQSAGKYDLPALATCRSAPRGLGGGRPMGGNHRSSGGPSLPALGIPGRIGTADGRILLTSLTYYIFFYHPCISSGPPAKRRGCPQT